MKIKAILVDKLPKSCAECIFGRRRLTEDDDCCDLRLDVCPLVLEEDYDTLKDFGDNYNSYKTEIPKALYPTTRNLDEGLKNNNLITMAKKLCEEATEVMEAATIYKMGGTSDTRDKLVQELMDTVQMSLNILNYINGDIGLDIQEEIRAHNYKLIERGWELDTSLCLEIKEVQHERQIQESSNL